MVEDERCIYAVYMMLAVIHNQRKVRAPQSCFFTEGWAHSSLLLLPMTIHVHGQLLVSVQAQKTTTNRNLQSVTKQDMRH